MNRDINYQKIQMRKYNKLYMLIYIYIDDVAELY